MPHTPYYKLTSITAIKSGNDIKLKELLSHFKEFIDSHDTEGNTLLIIAVINVQVNIVKMLLDEGADVNAPDTRGMTSLHYAGMLTLSYNYSIH